MYSAIFKTFFLSLCIIANTHLAMAQTASILPPAKTQYLDNSGKPLTSGKVFNYIPSTTTLKTTWQDAAETIPNTNPVILDAGGRAKILGEGSYRQIVKDRLDNIIWDAVTSSTGSGSSGPTATGDGDLVGTIKPWAGMTAPNQYAFTYGQEISRTTYAVLMTAITSSQATFCNSGSPTLTGLSDTTNFWIGMSVEVSCVAAGFSTIISKTATTVTLAANSNVTTNTTALFFPWGRGNGTTTFNLPDFRGIVPAGNNIMGGVASSNLTTTYFGATNPNSIGALGGSQSMNLNTSNIPTVASYNPSSVAISTTSTDTDIIRAPLSSTNAPGGGTQVPGFTASQAIGATGTIAASAILSLTTSSGGVATSASIYAIGSGYTNGAQTITVTGGVCSVQPQFTVTVAGNVFTGSPVLLTAGNCTTAPSNPAATSGGGGTGGILNVGYTGAPFSLIPPTRTTNFIIKITPDTNSATATGVTSLGGMTGDIACGTGLLCTGNTISSTSLTSLAVGTTPVTSGTSTGILYNNGGVLGNLAAGNPTFNVETYGGSLTATIAAAKLAGNGTTVHIPCGTYALGAGAVGLDLTSSSALTIKGSSNINGGAGQCVFITYTGTGTMLDGTASFGLDISGVYLRASGAGAKILDLSDAPYSRIYNSMIINDVSDAGNIGIDLDNTQMATVERNVFAVTGGIGVRGVDPAGTFSVKALINNNVFLTSTSIAISSPGQAWTISNNVSQNPTAFMIPGPATTCDIVHLTGNDIDDIVGGAGKTLISSNCGVTQSTNNRFGYSGGTTTNISQVNSTGTVISKGDRLSGTVGIAIGTGNFLTIEGYETIAPHAPTTLYTGTPATTFNVQTVVGPSAFEEDVSIGVDGVRLNRLNFHNATAGTNIFIQPPTGAIGTATNTLPNTTGTLLNSTNSVVVTNKSISGATNTLTNVPAVTSLIVDDTTTNAVMYPTWVTAATGQLPLKVSSTALTWNPGTGRMGIGTAAPNATLQVGPGTDASGLNPQFYVNNAGAATFAVRDSTGDIEFTMATSTSAGGLVALGTRTSHPLWIQTNAANIAAFHVSTGFSVGSTTDPGAGFISATGSIKGTTGFVLTNRLSSSTAPVATTFCTSPSIPANNGTAAFTINVGTACATSTGTITMPAATTGWVCDFHNVTAPATNIVEMTGGSTTTVTLTNYVRTTGVAGNWTDSNIIRAKCTAY